MMFKRLKKFLTRKKKEFNKILKLSTYLENGPKSPKINLGQIQLHLNNQRASIESLSEVEFQVFSQGGEDGILQYLIHKIEIPNKTFIEFGVENYTESNTRFLLINNHWSGYVIDGSSDNIRFIDHDIGSYGELYMKNAFITKDNINELLTIPVFNSETGILSIDIDGNDYWVWEAINCVHPIIIVAEYNSIFGSNTYWSIPYRSDFVRARDNAHQLYYGASLQALNFLANQKGYVFIGCNSKGNNAFFLRKDKMGAFLKPVTVEDGYVESKFREARNESGWISGRERIKAIEGLEVVDVRFGTILTIDSKLVKYS